MKEHGMTLKAALGLIICARTQASPNPGFLSQLKQLEITLLGSSTVDINELPRRETDRLALFNEDSDDDDKEEAQSVDTATHRNKQ